MRWSLNLGKILGIRVFIHWTFFLIFIYSGYLGTQDGGGIGGILFYSLLILAVFVCVVMHEYGHALTARRYGIKTRRIILLPIGGVAQLEKMPDEPKEELVVAFMGPAVNVAIAILLAPILYYFYTQGHFQNEEMITSYTGPVFLLQLAIINVVLVLFNLIPAFPMDGGRVLRAVLASRMDYVDATVYASRVGQFFAIAFAILGIFYNIFLIIIALFVYLGAQQEATMVQNRHFLKNFRVRQGMLSRYTTLSPQNTLYDAVKELLAGSDKDFLIVENDEVVGILTRDSLVQNLSEKGKELPIGEVMEQEFPTVEINEKLENAVTLMRSHNMPIIPVMEDGRLAGAVSMDNVSELFLVNKSEDVEDRMLLDSG